MSDSDRIVLFGPIVGKQRLLKRSGKTKTKFSIQISSTPLVHDFDAMRLGKPVADAIRDALGEQIKTNSLNYSVSPETVARRERYLRHPSGATYEKLFLGPRTKAGALRKGSKDSRPDPANLHRWGYFSGRLADGLAVRQSTTNKKFYVNVPKNRFDGTTFPSLDRFLRNLAQRIPALRDPSALIRTPAVRAAIDTSVRAMISKADSRAASKLRSLRSQRNKLLRQILRAGASAL